MDEAIGAIEGGEGEKARAGPVPGAVENAMGLIGGERSGGNDGEGEEGGARTVERRLLFLDIDGVLHGLNERHHPAGSNLEEIVARSNIEDENREKPGFSTPLLSSEFDPACVGQLKRIVEGTGCEVVLSSTWRTEACTWLAAKTALAKHSVFVEARTENLGGRGARCREIREHAEGGGCGVRFVAIDDDDLEEEPPAEQDDSVVEEEEEGKGRAVGRSWGLVEGSNFVRTDKAVGLTAANADLAIALLLDM